MKFSITFVIFSLAIMLVKPEANDASRPFNLVSTIQDYWARMIRPLSANPSSKYAIDSIVKRHNITQVKYLIEPVCRAEIINEESKCFRMAYELYRELNETISGDIELAAARSLCCLVTVWFNCTRNLISAECGSFHEQKFLYSFHNSTLYEEYVSNVDCNDPDDCSLTPFWRLAAISLIIGIFAGASFMLNFVIVQRLLFMCCDMCRSNRYGDDEYEDEEIPMQELRTTRVTHL